MAVSGQTKLTAGTVPATPAAGLVGVWADSTNKGLATVDENGRTLKAPALTASQELAVKHTVNSQTSAAPTGNVSTTAKMMGLAFAYTPDSTGRVVAIFSGMAFNSTAIGSGTSITGKFGTGVAPVNGAASAGTTFGIQQRFIAATVAGKHGFTCMAIISGLTPGTAYWFDLELVAVTSGGASVQDVQFIAVEV